MAIKAIEAHLRYVQEKELARDGSAFRTTKEVAEAIDCTTPTTQRYLKKMVSLGLVEGFPEGRTNIWRLVPTSHE